MKLRIHTAAMTLLALLAAAPAASALNVAGPLYGGVGICGVNSPATLTGLGTPRANSGSTANINDGVLTTRVDTFGIGNPSTLSYVGIRWPFLRADSVKTLTFTMACFNDGGWFGLAGLPSPATAGAALTSALLLEPSVQVTSDGGVTWTAVDVTTSYLNPVGPAPTGGADGAFMGGTPNPRTVPFTITLDTPVSAINGIRIIGENGGVADGNGFLGIFELGVDAGPVVDADTDGMEDAWETAHGLDAGANDASGDLDTDGLTNINEFLANADPQDSDSDNDGINDGPEVLTYQSNPTDSDTDDDGLSDGAEVAPGLGTNPRLADTDGDGLSDGAEVNTYLTLPLDADSDDDGFSDGQEVLTYFTNPLAASSRPVNIAVAGAAHFGYTSAIGTGNGTTYSQQGTTAAILNRIIDGNFTTRIDTYNGTSTNAVSFAGVRWPAPWALPVSRLELTMACFQDGGWFGPSNASPGPGNPLAFPTHITEPTVQTTVDGNTWTTVAATSNYVSQFTGHRIGGGGQPNPTSRTAAFQLTTPAVGIRGVRIIGSEGGVAGAGNPGFIGVFELTVQDTSTAPPDDLDGDGLTTPQEAANGTDPNDSDTDDDGLLDGAEVNTYHSNPLSVDSDGDHFRDGSEVQYAANPASAASFPDNVALLGAGIIGINDAIDGDAGSPLIHAGGAGSINDGNPATSVDTYNGTGGINSFVGILWTSPQTVKTLTLNLATFFDGGWFGPNGIDPGAGGALNATYLTEPEVQISTDGGVTWSTVAHTSNYLTALDGHNIGGGAFPNPSSKTATFTLDSAAVVNGIRLIGSEGGTASGGFLGCFELGVGQGPVAGDGDNDGLPDAWEIAKFGYVHAQHLHTDGEGDGSDNLLEYALGMNPLAADQPPAGVIEAGYLTMTITKVPGITYTVLSGADLTDFSVLDTTVLIDDATTLKVRDNTLISVGPRRFLKTTVQPAP